MKKALLSLILMVLSILALTQVPESFNYQVVVRDGFNNPLQNQDVSFKMSILKGSSSGVSQYSELHSANTGGLGIVNLVIGNGTGKTGNITTIDWGADKYFLKIEVDPTGGTSYSEMGITQLLSVPYALNSKTSETSSEDTGLKQRINILEDNLIGAGTYKLADIDGNQYNVVKIGTNVWMKENLKTTKFNDGSPIDYPGIDISSWNNNTSGAYAWYNNDEATYKGAYGALYNWFAVNSGKLCPSGWHVPTYDELITFRDYLTANGFNYDGTLSGNKIAKSLASTTGWTSSSNPGSVGNTDYPAFRNKSGFTAFPGGQLISGVYTGLGGHSNFWTSSTALAARWSIDIVYNFSDLKFNTNSPGVGFSVRCLKD